MKKILCLVMMTALVVVTAQADLIGYWTFDEGSGTTITSEVLKPDTTALTSTFVTGTPEWVPGMLGGAVRLGGGTGERFDIDMSAFNPGSTTPCTALTMMCWVSIEMQPTGGYTGLFTSRTSVGTQSGNPANVGPCQVGMNLVDGDQKFDFRVCNAGNYTGNDEYTEKKWQHVAMVWSQAEGTSKVYVDGGLIDTDTQTDPNSNGWLTTEIHEFNTIMLGLEESNSGRRFKGTIDELAMWTDALDATEIQTIYDNSKDGFGLGADGVQAYTTDPYSAKTVPTAALADGLVNYWKMNDGTGTSVVDFLAGDDWTVSHNNSNYQWVDGLLDGSIYLPSYYTGFNTSSNAIALAGLPAGGTEMTYAVWINPDRDICDTWAGLLSHSSALGFICAVDTVTACPAGYLDWDFRIFGRSLKSENSENDIKIVDGQWNLVTVTVDINEGNVPEALKVYINGKSAADYSTTAGTYGTFGPFPNETYQYGRDRADGNRRYAGLTDEMMIWDRVLSQEEVITLYNRNQGVELDELFVAESVDESIEGVVQSVSVPVSIAQLDPNATVTFPITVTAVPADVNALNDLTVAPVTFTAIDEVQNIVFTTIDNNDRELDRIWGFTTVVDPNGTVDYSVGYIEITVLDDDVPQFVMTGADDVVVAEHLDIGDVEDTFTVGLDSDLEGSEAITLDLSADPNFITLSTYQIDFSAGSDDPEIVTVTAVDNTDIDNGTVPYESYTKLITVATTTTDLDAMADAPDVTVTILENDCGAMGYKTGDFDKDCKVDILDLTLLAGQWFNCSFPNDPDCVTAP